jgi:DNA-binding CsgD family transcriptional regulator
MRQAGARRPKWSINRHGPARKGRTEAERRVVYLIADGHTDKEVAKALAISPNTVGTHVRSAYTKLGVQSRVQLVNIPIGEYIARPGWVALSCAPSVVTATTEPDSLKSMTDRQPAVCKADMAAAP